MKLHLDKNAFGVLLEDINSRTGYRTDVLEKDYYSIQYRKELFKTFVRSVRLWDNHIEIEYNFTGSDDDGKPHIVTKELSRLEDKESASVRADSTQAHQAGALSILNKDLLWKEICASRVRHF